MKMNMKIKHEEDDDDDDYSYRIPIGFLKDSYDFLLFSSDSLRFSPMTEANELRPPN